MAIALWVDPSPLSLGDGLCRNRRPQSTPRERERAGPRKMSVSSSFDATSTALLLSVCGRRRGVAGDSECALFSKFSVRCIVPSSLQRVSFIRCRNRDSAKTPFPIIPLFLCCAVFCTQCVMLCALRPQPTTRLSAGALFAALNLSFSCDLQSQLFSGILYNEWQCVFSTDKESDCLSDSWTIYRARALRGAPKGRWTDCEGTRHVIGRRLCGGLLRTKKLPPPSFVYGREALIY